MSIIETKFRKKYVETPELKTNALVCNKFNYTGELSEESLGLPIFDITDKDEGTWYPVLKKLVINDNPAGNGAFRNVQLSTDENSAFHVLNDAKIKTITQIQRDDSRGDVSIGMECFMVLYGKKADNTYGFIAKSVNKNVQSHRGGTLTWNFSDIEWNYKNQYTKLIITLAQVPYAYDQDGSFTLDENMNRIELDFFEAYGENGPTFPTVAYIPNVNSDGTKTYENMKMSCKGSNGGQCVVMSTNNTNTQNFTPQITISYTDLELQPSTVLHKDNTQVHVTPSEKSKLMATATQFYNHTNNTQIHVTAQQKSKWDSVGDVAQLTAGDFIEINDNKISVKTSSSISNDTNTVPTSAALYAHSSDNSLHVTSSLSSEVAKISTLQTNVNNHIGDNTHLTSAQKESIEQISIINDSISDVSEKIDNVNSILSVRTNVFSTLREGLVAADAGKMKTSCIQLSKKHFTTGTIPTIEIPYYNGWDFQNISPGDGYVNTYAKAYLAVQVFYDNEDDNTVKTLSQTYFSSDTQTQLYGTSGTMTFTFENLIIPNEYKFVRLMCVSDTSAAPDGRTQTNCLPFRVRVLSLENNNGDYTSFDDDDCKLFNPGGNYVAYVNATTVTSILDSLEDLPTINSEFTTHVQNSSIHFSKSEIMDNVAGSLETWDMSLGASVKGAQGIAYAQICNNHVLQEGSYLTKIVVPQHTNPQASEVTTGVDLYLVIFGDNEDSASSDETKWQFVTCSTNEGQQQIGGNSSTKPDLVFEFEKGIDLGLYRRYRFFYVTDRTVTPTLPTVFGSGYTGVKMAFPSRGIDADCKVRMTGGGWATSHTFPAIIHFIKDSAELRSINHKDNDEKHLTVGFRDTVSSAISKISEIEDKINDINFVLGVEKQEYTTFSSELPVPTDVTNHDTTQIILSSSRCVSGKIKKIEIPYTKGKGTTGYLAVQIIHSGESANIEKTLDDTYFSTETQTQTNNQSGVSTFHFDNLFIPSDFYAIRLSFVSNKNTAPDYGGSNCLTYAIRMVSITESDYSNPVHNHDGYKIFNPANQGYSYSNTSYGVIVSVESVKSSFDFITGELYMLKKVIS